MPPSTDSRVVLITGATGPAGHAAARRFAGEGARLALVSRDRARLEEMGHGLGIDADSWMTVTSDLSGSGAARSVVAAVEERWGRIDVLLHLIGGWVGGTAVVDLDHDEVRGMLEQHLWTTLRIVQQVVPGMLERHFGRVLAVSSPFATDIRPRGASYAVGKASEEAIIRSLAREVAGTGVTANLVLARTIGPEHTSAEELAETLAFLASPAAAAINGARIPLDGVTS
ncbi:MAG TPA: SDR family oxidoreductase [Candidatus Limnocylindrales bacterium]